jgi:hypothetical protein
MGPLIAPHLFLIVMLSYRWTCPDGVGQVWREIQNNQVKAGSDVFDGGRTGPMRWWCQAFGVRWGCSTRAGQVLGEGGGGQTSPTWDLCHAFGTRHSRTSPTSDLCHNSVIQWTFLMGSDKSHVTEEFGLWKNWKFEHFAIFTNVFVVSLLIVRHTYASNKIKNSFMSWVLLFQGFTTWFSTIPHLQTHPKR